MELAGFPRYPLLFGPSPVHPLERLTEHLGGASIWAKREDVNSGLAFGGNKTRKLEYLVADALAQGADTLVSIGGVQSNHTRQVAAAAARAGLKAVLVQQSWVDWPESGYDKVGNIQLSRILGADVRLVGSASGIAFTQDWATGITAEIEAAGGRPYVIPAGASDHRLGGLGFANWVVELEAQEAELGVFFVAVIVASGTGGTQGGMLAGVALGRARRILGIDISAAKDDTLDAVTRIARSTAELIGARAIKDDEILLDDRYHAGVYGIPDESTLDAIRTCARLEGIITDPVYEGKSMAALIDLVRRGEIDRHSNVLYAHLGGQPAVSAYASVLN
ncbi:MAG TPA: 1-aminocyclopropane-1-carboxylate deaminase [Amycolatopsis sp.]|nr:1-aminocyclopropane-1-carboxylate deaminase [Amycolatopsis sp.]